MEFGLFEPLALSLGLGLLVGLQREWKESEIAGIRTFPMFTLLGTISAILAEPFGGWIIAAGMLAVTGNLLIANYAKVHNSEGEPGLTTEMAALVMFGVGAVIGAGYTGPGVAVGGVVAVLLHWKQELHGFVRRIGDRDVRAIFHLVLIALVILPVLPNKTFGPYDVWNPHKIWMIVVLIVGISMTAYVAYKFLGGRVGSLLGGILGGLISSTATTVSYARQAKNNREIVPIAALVILVASTIVNARVLFEIGVVAPQLLSAAGPPMAIMLVVMAVLSAVVFWWAGGRQAENPLHDNPAQLNTAVIFAGLYAVILFVVAAVKDHFGSEALYGVAVISGLTDVDAITLSMAELTKKDQLKPQVAWRLILVATMANLVFKAGAAGFLGGARLFAYIALLFGISIAVGLALVWFWPDWQIQLDALLPNA